MTAILHGVENFLAVRPEAGPPAERLA